MHSTLIQVTLYLQLKSTKQFHKKKIIQYARNNVCDIEREASMTSTIK